MSQKQAKRIRRLERRVLELENLFTPEIKAFREREFRKECERINMAMDAQWMPEEPRKGIFRRIADLFGRKGREK